MIAQTVLSILVMSSIGHATVFLSEDWETGTPPANWPYKVCPVDSLSFNGWSNADWHNDCATPDPIVPNWTGYGLDTSQRKSGSRSWTGVNHNPERTSGDVIKRFPSSPNNAKFYLGTWLRYEGNCAAASAAGRGWCDFTESRGEPAAHFLFLNTAVGFTGVRINILTRVPYASSPQCEDNTTGGGPFASFSIQMDGNDVPSGRWVHPTEPNGCWNLLRHLNEWHWYVFAFHPKNGAGSPGDLEIYVDDVLSYTATNVQWASGGSPNHAEAVIISNYVNDPAMMNGSVLRHWQDDLIITDIFPRMPGGGTGPTPTPVPRLRAPANVRVLP